MIEVNGEIERDYEIAKAFGLQILDACLQDIAFARFLLKKNHERRQKHHHVYDRRHLNANISNNFESNNQNEFERNRDIYVDLNQAILAVSSTSSSGVSMLHIMVYKDLSKQLQLLLDFGANANLTNKNQETALHWCAKLTSKRCAKVLLDHFCKNKQIEAALSIRDASNSTPLHAAVAAGNLAIIPLFVDYLDMQFTSRESEHSERLEMLNISSSTSSSPFLITDIDNCTPIMIASNYARATAHALATMESENKKNGQDAANQQRFDDGNVFIAITFLLLRYHQQRGLPIPPEALSISNSVVKSFSVPSTTQTIQNTDVHGLQLDLSTVNGSTNRPSDVKSSPQLSDRVNDKNESNFATPSLENCYPADLDADAVDLLINQLNDQHQYLLDQKRLISKHESPDLPTVVGNAMQKASRPRTAPKSHKPKEFSLRKEDNATSGEIVVADEIDAAAQKQKNLPVITRKPLLQSHSSAMLRESPPTAYTVMGGELVPTSTSPTTVYEGIIAKYRQQQQQQQQVSNSRPSSAIKAKLASISFKKAQLDAVSASKSSVSLLKPIRKDTSSSPPKKPAFFIRRSDALSQMPPAIIKPSIFDGVRIGIDEDNKIDLDLEIFASMMKQGKVVSAEPAATSAEKARRRTSMMQSFSSIGSIGSFAEPFETRASLDPRMAKKLMSAMPKYDTLFLPATSAPFLPTKTRRNPTTAAAQNDFLSAIAQATAAVQSQSPGKITVHTDPYYSKRMDVIVIVEHCCDCEQHSTQSLRHDPKKYVQMANDVLYSIIEFISSSAVSGSNGDDHYPVRLFCMRTKPLTPDRIGAFEVTVAINITPPMQPSSAAAVPQHLHQGGGNSGVGSAKRGSSLLRRSDAPHLRQNPILEEEQPVVDSVWATNLIYSKLQTKSWPSVHAIQKKVEQFLSVVQSGERVHQFFHSTIEEVNQTDVGGHAVSEEEILKERMAAKVRAIEESYSKWVERMRIPPKVEKHNLDLEWPTTAIKKRAPASMYSLSPGGKLIHGGSNDISNREEVQHPLGPYIDFKLLGGLSTTGFEDTVLRHFEVLDTTQ